tara:strand:- start:1847 stop:2272 length:426 start_codon:yes stop_codon:yes gene_type:complete
MNKRLLTLLSICIAAISSFSLNATEPEATEEPELIGLNFHAKWCSACKKIDSNLDEALATSSRPDFKLVTLDLDNKATQHESESIADAVGLLDIYKTTGVKTGFILLVDATTHEVIDKIDRKDKSDAMAAKLDKALAAAKS